MGAVGSALIAAWIAYSTFVALVAVGFASGELRLRGLVIAVLVCAIGKLVLGYVSYDAMFPSVVAVVDVALILIVVKGDVKL